MDTENKTLIPSQEEGLKSEVLGLREKSIKVTGVIYVLASTGKKMTSRSVAEYFFAEPSYTDVTRANSALNKGAREGMILKEKNPFGNKNLWQIKPEGVELLRKLQTDYLEPNGLSLDDFPGLHPENATEEPQPAPNGESTHQAEAPQADGGDT